MKCLGAGLLLLALAACQPPVTDGAADDVDAQPQPAAADSHPAGSRVARSEAALWRVSRYEQLQHAAQEAGAPFGVLLLGASGTEVCVLDTIALEKLHGAYRDDPGLTLSLAELRAFQARFCPAEKPLDRREAERVEMQRRIEAGDADALLISALLEADEQMDHEDRHALRLAAERTSAETRSPAVFEALQILLLEATFFDPAKVIDRPLGMDDEALRDAWGHAVLLARCERFGGCGPGSLMVYRMCMPQHCRRGLDVRGYVRDQLSRDGYEEAQRRARQLLAKA